MKKTKSEKSAQDAPALATDDSKYPYGLSLHLDEDSLKKLGISKMPEVGKEFMLHAKVMVDSVSESEYKDGEASKNLGLQITHMELEGESHSEKNEKRASKLYKE